MLSPKLGLLWRRFELLPPEHWLERHKNKVFPDRKFTQFVYLASNAFHKKYSTRTLECISLKILSNKNSNFDFNGQKLWRGFVDIKTRPSRKFTEYCSLNFTIYFFPNGKQKISLCDINESSNTASLIAQHCFKVFHWWQAAVHKKRNHCILIELFECIFSVSLDFISYWRAHFAVSRDTAVKSARCNVNVGELL